MKSKMKEDEGKYSALGIVVYNICVLPSIIHLKATAVLKVSKRKCVSYTAWMLSIILYKCIWNCWAAIELSGSVFVGVLEKCWNLFIFSEWKKLKTMLCAVNLCCVFWGVSRVNASVLSSHRCLTGGYKQYIHMYIHKWSIVEVPLC